MQIPHSTDLLTLYERIIAVEPKPDHFADADQGATIERCAEGVHVCNLYQWEAESRIRNPSQSDSAVAALKRQIDESNLARHGHVERFDALCVDALPLTSRPAPWHGVRLNSETLGQIADRMSVLTAKLAFYRQITSGPDLADLVELQRSYLTICYDQFLSALQADEAYMLASRQLKAYANSELTNV